VKRLLSFNWLPDCLSFRKRLAGYVSLWIIPLIIAEIHLIEDRPNSTFQSKLSEWLCGIAAFPFYEVLGFERFACAIAHSRSLLILLLPPAVYLTVAACIFSISRTRPLLWLYGIQAILLIVSLVYAFKLTTELNNGP
jgi:hypothetical protein